LKELAKAVGDALREARRERGLTLQDVGVLSGGRFKPSALGGYERGERSISLARFTMLASLYGLPADRLLAKTLERVTPLAREELVVDLTKLPLVAEDDARLVAEFIHKVRAQRADYMSDVITLRSGDLEALALTARVHPRTLRTRLEPALRSGSGSDRRPARPSGPSVILP
jgi:transcriptional regulator with XRE-family HTH domain